MNISYNNHPSKAQFHYGFTIIELSLSIALISVLSIAIVLIITNAISSYHRGITLNQINTAGTEVVDDIRGTIQNSPARSVISQCSSIYSNLNQADQKIQCEKDKGKNFILVQRFATVKVGGRKIGTNNSVPVFGAFCTGLYSYIWNSGYYFNESEYAVDGVEAARLTYQVIRDGTTQTVTYPETFKLLKVPDDSRSVCISAVNGPKDSTQNNRYSVDRNGANSINYGSNMFDISSYYALEEEPVEILTGNSLALYNLDTAPPAESSTRNNIFYDVSFILGTIQGGINIKASGDFCATPEGYNAAIENFDYCAINKFNFAAQANGG